MTTLVQFARLLYIFVVSTWLAGSVLSAILYLSPLIRQSNFFEPFEKLFPSFKKYSQRSKEDHTMATRWLVFMIVPFASLYSLAAYLRHRILYNLKRPNAYGRLGAHVRDKAQRRLEAIKIELESLTPKLKELREQLPIETFRAIDERVFRQPRAFFAPGIGLLRARDPESELRQRIEIFEAYRLVLTDEQTKLLSEQRPNDDAPALETETRDTDKVMNTCRDHPITRNYADGATKATM